MTDAIIIPLRPGNIKLLVNKLVKKGVLHITLQEVETARSDNRQKATYIDETTDLSIRVPIVHMLTLCKAFGHKPSLVQVIGAISKLPLINILRADRDTSRRKGSELPSAKTLKHLLLLISSLLPPNRIHTHCVTPCGRCRRFKKRGGHADRVSWATLQGVHMKASQTLTTTRRRVRR